MPMNLAELLNSPHETSGLEMKGPGNVSEPHYFSIIAKAIMAMSNRRDGGIIVVGAVPAPSGQGFVSKGLSTEERAAFNHDDLSSALASYTAPHASFSMSLQDRNGDAVGLIEVQEFSTVPIICINGLSEQRKKKHVDLLKRGVIYVRSRRMPSSVPVETEEDMRDLVDLAADKHLRTFFKRLSLIGVDIGQEAAISDAERFAKQRAEFDEDP